ncbi:MAG: outer membrane protein assembly factor BamD [Deltaproteobacteria bacterium]|nr:outer membrane protein assembly factor BamD [Deltaproteobacteria bacterium]
MAQRILALSAILLALTACGSTGSASGYFGRIFGFQSGSDRDLGADEPRVLAREAQDLMAADNYKDAADLWRQLKDQYPYSEYAMLAELRLGDALFLQEKFIEALAAYEDFERLHPENEAVPYAIYQQAMCYYSRMKGIDRDQTPTIQTIQTMARLVEMYPSSRYAAMARARIAEAQNNLAGHEFYVGEFYFRRKDYQAAMNRYLGLLEYYPDSGYHQRALTRIAEYRQLVQDGVVAEDANLRDAIYDSPFLSAPLSPYGTLF